ncbi:hypothetical protein [Salinicola lusitanus]|uniref:hypothetical protein n=1 Tax=Salinicola lusitanus TaxID=1949085 RepID=UPI000DA149DA|nr:hypothetical protein [Salinicola lusitanus]
MNITLTPCVADFEVIYTFDGEKVTAKIGEQSDTVDFSEMGEGHCHSYQIDTSLPHNVFHGAVRDGSEGLTVKLLSPYPDRIHREDDESDSDYQARKAEWESKQVERTETV